MIVTWTTLQIENKNKNWFCVCHNLYHSKEMDLWACFFPCIMDLWACFHLSRWIYEHVFIYHGFMSMFSSIMDLWACFHISWIYEHAFTYHGFMSMFFSSIMDLWECFHLSWIYGHVFIYHFLSTHSQVQFAYVTNCTIRKKERLFSW